MVINEFLVVLRFVCVSCILLSYFEKKNSSYVSGLSICIFVAFCVCMSVNVPMFLIGDYTSYVCGIYIVLCHLSSYTS